MQLQGQELHIAQAVELCRRVLRDRTSRPGDRALALTWLAHLVGDAHQPCHAGSLYVERVFPDGDRGANSIPLKQGWNMHSLWDGLLGQRFDRAEVQRGVARIAASDKLLERGQRAAKMVDGLDPLTWLDESRHFGVTHVYTPQVLQSVIAVARGLTAEIQPIDVPDAYLKRAGQLARGRVAEAAHRLAAIWHAGLVE